MQSVNWEKAAEFLEVDRTVKEVDWAQPGTTGAYHTLATFCNKRLKFYESDRNDPNKEALSDLSPYFHFGKECVHCRCRKSKLYIITYLFSTSLMR